MNFIYENTGLTHYIYNILDMYNMDNFIDRFQAVKIKTDKGYTDKEHIHYIDFKVALEQDLKTNNNGMHDVFKYIFDYIRQTNTRFAKEYPCGEVDPLSIKLLDFSTQTDFLHKKRQLLENRIYSTKLYFPIDNKIVILVYALKSSSPDAPLSQEELKIFLSKS